VTNIFKLDTAKTIGASFFTFSMFLKDVRLKVQLWDTAGQERFRSMAPMYYRRSNAALIVYDITSSASFESAKTWIREMKDRVDQPLVLFLIGNKVDLESQRKVSVEMGEEYAASIGAIHMQTSAASGTGVSELFVRAADELATFSERSLASSNVDSPTDLYTPIATPPTLPILSGHQTPALSLRREHTVAPKTDSTCTC
jgi:Ras-related protein Rab-21